MTDDLRALLERCRHHLVTLTGLEVCDGAAPEYRFRIDEGALISELDAALKGHVAATVNVILNRMEEEGLP